MPNKLLQEIQKLSRDERLELIDEIWETIGDDIEQANLRAPAIIVIGEVVRLREKLRWFEKEAEIIAAPANIASYKSAIAA